jgi:hypothetical protein
MTAVTAYDTWRWDVEYFFECVSNGAFNSPDWQPSSTYDVDDLPLGTELCFRVRARDELGHMTGWSVVRCTIVSPFIEPEDTNAPAPAPYLLTIEPNAPNSIVMTASISYDISDVEYYFMCTHGDGNDSGWLSFPEGVLPTYTDYNLAPETRYCYRVKARDKSPNQNETVLSDERCVTTPEEEDTMPPVPDPMLWDFSVMDVNTYVIDGRPHEIFLGPDPLWDYYVTMRADPNTIDMPPGSPYGVEFYFECTTNPGFSSPGWIPYPGPPYIYTVKVGQSGLDHRFRVKARDRSPNRNETGWSSIERARTP